HFTKSCYLDPTPVHVRRTCRGEPRRMPVRRAYSYIRFSSPEQAKGDSLRRQLVLTDALVKKHGWVLDDSLHLRDLAVSAFRGTNVTEGAFAGFLAAIEANKVPRGSVLIVESLDRITRQEPFDSLPLVMGILKKGILIATVSPERLYEKKPGA